MSLTIIRQSVLGVAVVSIAGCGSDSPTGGMPASTDGVAIRSRSVTLVPGDSATLGLVVSLGSTVRATAGTGIGSPSDSIPNREVVWGVRDASVAGIDAAGVLFARRPGRTVVSASYGSRVDSITATVEPRRRNGRFTSIAVGFGHACGVLLEARVACWGENSFGQLGNGFTPRFSFFATPQLVSGLASIAQIALGIQHSCARDRDGQVWCAGDNRVGQVTGSAGGSYGTFVAVGSGRRFATIDADGDQTCGIVVDGPLVCWGSGFTGLQEFNAPNGGRFRSVSLGSLHRCALTDDGTSYCWGDNQFGQLGSGTTVPTLLPAAVRTSRRFAMLSAGASSTCALEASGQAWCWGAGNSGQLGTGFTLNSLTPAIVDQAAVRFTSISSASRHACALDESGGAWCWGFDGRGALGTGRALSLDDGSAAAFRLSPIPVVGGLSYSQVVAGFSGTTCAIGGDREAYCWGSNQTGLLGAGAIRWQLPAFPFAATSSPQPVLEP